MNMCDLQSESDPDDTNFFLEFQKLADDRSAIEDKLSRCDPKWLHIYRPFIARMNRKSLDNGLVAYADLLGSYSDFIRFQDFQDVSTTMTNLQQDLRDVQQAAGEIYQLVKIAINTGNEQDVRRLKDLEISVRQQFICCCNKIQRTEREILDIFWRGRRSY
jgi:hypothetical protein